MSNTMRWRYGDTNPVYAKPNPSVVVEVGDLLYLVSGQVQPASSLGDLGTKAANQEAFHDSFVGVAMQGSPQDGQDNVRVATSGVFEFACSATTFVLGDLLGVDENAAGDELTSQAVAKVAACNLAVGRCVKAATSATKVLLSIESTVLHGGPQVMA